MKNFKISILILTTLFLSSCVEENTSDELTTVSETEAVDIVEASLASKSGGALKTTEEYSKTYEEEYSLQDICNETITDSFEFNYDGTLVKATYNYSWSTILNCDTLLSILIPQSASLTATSSGTYTTNRLESDDSSTFTSTVTGLGFTDSDFIYNATYERTGTQKIKTRQNDIDIASQFSISLDNLTVNKSDYMVESGSGSFTLSGSSTGGEFLYTGDIVFNGDATATITINETEYTIQLN